MPVGVVNRIEKLFRVFLWWGLGEEKKFHLVKWKTICGLVVYGVGSV